MSASICKYSVPQFEYQLEYAPVHVLSTAKLAAGESSWRGAIPDPRADRLRMPRSQGRHNFLLALGTPASGSVAKLCWKMEDPSLFPSCFFLLNLRLTIYIST
eukprot:g32859.t1